MACKRSVIGYTDNPCVRCGSSVFRRVEVRSSDWIQNCSGQWNTSREKENLKTNTSNNWLSLGSVIKIRSGSFIVRIISILKMDRRGQKRAAESELERAALRFSKGTSGVRRRRWVAHCAELEFARVSASVAS